MKIIITSDYKMFMTLSRTQFNFHHLPLVLLLMNDLYKFYKCVIILMKI